MHSEHDERSGARFDAGASTVVRTVDGEDAPRVAVLCSVTVGFLAHCLELPRANRFLARSSCVSRALAAIR